MNVNFNPNVTVKAAELAAVEKQQALQQEGAVAVKPGATILRGANVTVSESPVDLEKLLGTLRNAANNASQSAFLRKMDNSLSAAINHTQNAMKVDEKNMALLDEAKKLTEKKTGIEAEIAKAQEDKDLLETEISQLKETLAQQNKQVASLENEIDKLKKEIDGTTDPKRKEALQKELGVKQNELTKMKGAVATTTESIAQKTTDLGRLNDEISGKKTQVKQLEADVKGTLAKVQDVKVLLNLAQALGLELSDLLQFLNAQEEDRGEEVEDRLVENDPWRLIREDIISQKDEMLTDEISKKRQEFTLGV